MSLHRGIDGSEPVHPDGTGHLAGSHEERRSTRTTILGTGTLACPACDAPVAPSPGPSSPSDPLACPFCLRSGPIRDFLSLTTPSRPARVTIRVLRPTLN